ncbi:hypothetical protein ACNQFZ_18425 [Schinkia sp. CFF1]
MNPSLKQQLREWKQIDQEPTPKKRKKNCNKKKQIPQENQLSEREWEDIMGMHMPKYKRNRGAFRQI